MDFPVNSMPPLPTIHVWSHESIGIALGGLLNTSMASQASTTYPAASRIIYVPFALAMTVTVVKMWAYNGGTVNGNTNVGIYSASGVKIIDIGSGVAQVNANVLQTFDITDTLIGPGDFYMAIISSSAGPTSTFFSTTAGTVGLAKAMGVLQEAGGTSVLPANATFATISSGVIPQFGLSTRADL